MRPLLIAALVLALAAPAVAQEIDVPVVSAMPSDPPVEIAYTSPAPSSLLWRTVDAAFLGTTAAIAVKALQHGQPKQETAGLFVIYGYSFRYATGVMARDRVETMESGIVAPERGHPRQAMAIRAALVAFNAWALHAQFRKP